MGRRKKTPAEKLKMIGVRVTPEQELEIANIAARSNTDISRAARRLIEKGITFERILDEKIPELISKIA
jgi:hypothetical protein